MKTELFLDKSIILYHSDNIKLDKNNPKFKQNVLNSDQKYEGWGNAYYTILKDNKNYKLFYRGITNDCKNIAHEQTTPYEEIALAESDDGLCFNKKYCLTYRKNNIILKHKFCHNFYPFYNYKNNNYLAISGTGLNSNGLFLLNSTNGFDWNKNKKIADEKSILPGWNHINHFDSHNCFCYNKEDGYYYIYVRDNQHRPVERRYVQFTKTKNFQNFDKFKNIIISNKDCSKMHIYTFNAFKYNNYFFAIPTFSEPKSSNKRSNMLLFSENGYEWCVINEKFFSLNKEHMSVTNYVHSIDGKEIYFYIHNKFSLPDNHIDCYSIGKDRFTKLICKGTEWGFIKTKLINLSNNKILINYESTGEKGSVQVILKDKDDNIIFKSLEYTGNEIDKSICWETNDKSFIPGNYFIEFKLFDCILYSFSYNV